MSFLVITCLYNNFTYSLPNIYNENFIITPGKNEKLLINFSNYPLHRISPVIKYMASSLLLVTIFWTYNTIMAKTFYNIEMSNWFFTF